VLFKDFLLHVEKTLELNFNEIDCWFLKSDQVKNYRPKNGGWTINEILEHIYLTNHFLSILINKAAEKSLKNPYDLNGTDFVYDYETLNLLEEIGIHQSFEWIRPEHMEPNGDIEIEVVRENIKCQVKNCVEILHNFKNGEGLNVKTKMSVNNLGKIDVYQYVHFLSLHGKRHVDQMKKNELEFNEKVL
jgi:hypothetical protein